MIAVCRRAESVTYQTDDGSLCSQCKIRTAVGDSTSDEEDELRGRKKRTIPDKCDVDDGSLADLSASLSSFRSSSTERSLEHRIYCRRQQRHRAVVKKTVRLNCYCRDYGLGRKVNLFIALFVKATEPRVVSSTSRHVTHTECVYISSFRPDLTRIHEQGGCTEWADSTTSSARSEV
jgi:hypothetical protein